MTVHFSGRFWSRDYFPNIFVPQVQYFCESMVKRILPVFSTIEQEANDLADKEFKRLGNLPANEYDILDMADLADQADKAGLAHYEVMAGVRQAIINMAVAALYHLFEQQVLIFFRQQLRHPSQEDVVRNLNVGIFVRKAREGGVDVEALPSWKRIQELRLIANTVKHAAGRSAEDLSNLRPDLLVHPLERGSEFSWPTSSRHVYAPLAGQDIYATADDIELYGQALVAFWQEFGQAIENL